jgi:hypothetical protein
MEVARDPLGTDLGRTSPAKNRLTVLLLQAGQNGFESKPRTACA